MVVPSSSPRIDLGDIGLNQVDEHGVEWICERVTGWAGSPSGTGGVTQRTGQHGGWAPPQYLSPRAVTVTGVIVAPTATAREQAEQRLAAALDLDRFVLVVHEASGPKGAIARRDGELDLEVLNAATSRWIAILVCADPRRYSLAEHAVNGLRLPSIIGGLVAPFRLPLTVNGSSVSGDAQAINAGNEATHVRIILRGPVAQPRLTNTRTAQSFTYVQDLAAGEWVDINTADHTVLLQGAASRRQHLLGEFWSLLPGSNEIAFRAAAPSVAASVDLSWRDAWR